MLKNVRKEYSAKLLSAKNKKHITKIWGTLISELKTTKPEIAEFRINPTNEFITPSTIKKFITDIRKEVINTEIDTKINTKKYRKGDKYTEIKRGKTYRKPKTLAEKRLLWAFGLMYCYEERKFKPMSDNAICIAPLETTAKRAKQAETKLNERLEEQKQVKKGQIETTIKHLLNSIDWRSICLGLCLATGRRSIEILKTATFTQIKGCTDKLKFKGQAKTKNNPTFEIPVLFIDAKTVQAKLKQLRQMKDFAGLDNEAVHNTTVVDLNRFFNTHKQKNPITSFHAAKELSNDRLHPHDLRKIYTVHCVENLKGNTNTRVYVQSILGHEDRNTGIHYENIILI